MEIVEAQNINRIEYWVDSDPGFGAAIVLTGLPLEPTINNFVSVIGGLSAGSHKVGFRSKDSEGRWSHTNIIHVNVTSPIIAGNIIAVEYFWDIDAGFGNNAIVELTPGETFVGTFDATVPLLPTGDHLLFCRTLDNDGRYSHTNISEVMLDTKDFEKSGIGIYPNPVISDLNVSIDNNEKCRLIIYDINGKIVSDTNVNGTSKVDMSHCPSGAYTAYFWKELNKIHVVKLIKR